MRKIREILRLHALGYSVRDIGRSCGVAASTVSLCLQRAAAAGLTWPLPTDLDETVLEQRLYRRPALPPAAHRPQPDWARVDQELRQKGVTLLQLWDEYRQQTPHAYSYSQFCYHYHQWRQTQDVVLRQVYKAGEKCFVDYAGPTVPIVDPHTGEIRPAFVFVACLGASNYTYVEATATQDLPAWILAHVHAFEFFGGVPAVVVPDNPKTGVRTPSFYDPELNPTYREFGEHYGVAIIPARPRHPRDKAKVETAVQIVERHVLAPLRHRTFFSLEEANAALRQQLDALNARPFQKRPGSRQTLFDTLDRPALRPLPPTRYEYAEWKRARVNIDYHVEIRAVYYSVPYQLVRQEVDVRLTAQTVEIFHKGRRVASHVRAYQKGTFVTDPAHRPAAHQRHLEWSPSRLLAWAEKTGPHTREVVQTILDRKPHPEQGYRACLGLMRLGKRYGADRLEAACGRALAIQSPTYRSVQAILQRNLDQAPLPAETAKPTPPHENVRGPGYFSS
jgi:transposase